MGRLYRDKKDYARATEYHTRALQIRRKLQGDRSLEVADSLHSLGMIAYSKHDYQSAIASFKEEYGIYQANQKEYWALAFNLGFALAARAEYAEAETFYRRALTIAQKMYGEKHVFYGHCLRGLGVFLFESRGDASSAEPLLRQGLELTKQALGNTNLAYLAGARVLVDLLKETGRLQEAEQLARAGLTIAAIGGPSELGPYYRSDMADVLIAAGRINEAETFLDEGNVRKNETGSHLEVASNLVLIGQLRRAQKRHEQAETYLTEALEIRRKILPPHHLLVAATELELGYTLTDLAKYVEGEKHLLQAMATRRQHLGASHPRTLESRGALLTLYRAWGKPEKASALPASSY
jgi:tetratricopeptide (TPR) repeat protein